MADTAGPVTRSRARAPDTAHMPQSAAPSTKGKKSSKRSNRKSKAAAISPFNHIEQIKHEPDTTQTHEDNDTHQPATVHHAAKPVAEPESGPIDAPLCNDDAQQMPATVTAAAAEGPAAAASPGHAPSTVAIAGLTPVALGNSAGGCPAATPATMGPSPVMPIKLDSLWSPTVPATGEMVSLTPPGSTPASCTRGTSAAGLDLAALFISTPAPATASPVSGLVSATQPEPAEDAASAAQNFAFQVSSSDAAVQDAASCGKADSTAAAIQPALPEAASFGSPAPIKDEADEAGTVLVLSATTKATTPACSPAPLAAAVGNLTPGSPFPEDDDDLPPADEEFPEEAAMMQAITPAADSMDLQMAVDTSSPATHGTLPDTATTAQLIVHNQTADGQLSSDNSMQVQAPAALHAEHVEMEHADQETAEKVMVQQLQGMQEVAMVEQEMQAVADQLDGALPTSVQAATAAAEPADDGDEPMDELDNPALHGEADCTDLAMPPAPEAAASPELANSPTSTSAAATAASAPGCAANNNLPTVPRSALAKCSLVSRGTGSSMVKKSAHVVLRDAHATPQAAGTGHQAAAGSAAARRILASTPAGALDWDTGSSPGHTPYPSKAKVKTATAAANRLSTSTVASKPATCTVSHKKEIGYARAHSALKHHAAAAADQTRRSPAAVACGSGSPQKDGAACSPAADTPGTAGGSPGRWRASSSPGVSAGSAAQLSGSRLLQPTISFSAKTRAGAQPDVDSLVWRAPSPVKTALSASTGAVRLASKVVVPSPNRTGAAACEPSIKSLKKSIRDKMEKRAVATLAESDGAARGAKVHGMQEMRGSKPMKPVPGGDFQDEEDLDFDQDIEQYDEQGGQHDDQTADELAASMSGLRVGELRPHQPAGPLKGVAAPRGKHLVFDNEGRAKETPASKLRAKPKHIYFNDCGEPMAEPPAEQTRVGWRL